MKNLILIVAVTSLFTCLIVGCNFDDSVTTSASETNSIQGTWSLRHVKGNNMDLNYSPGNVSWSFDSKASKIIVENKAKNDDSNHYNNLKSGTYSYSMFHQVLSSYISINADEVGLLRVNDDVLIIDENKKRDQIQTDGYILTFRR